MSLMLKVAKFSMVGATVVSLFACSYVPEVTDVFPDRKDEYKKSHEIPSLEVPPELSSVPPDEFDGARAATPVPAAPVRSTTARTYPLNDNISEVELIEDGEFNHLLIRDSMRNTWRKTVRILGELGYAIEDRNRQQSVIYLDITKEIESGLLGSLSFWKSDEETIVYLVDLEGIRQGVIIRVLNEDSEPVNDEVSTQIYDDLVAQFTR